MWVLCDSVVLFSCWLILGCFGSLCLPVFEIVLLSEICGLLLIVWLDCVLLVELDVYD